MNIRTWVRRLERRRLDRRAEEAADADLLRRIDEGRRRVADLRVAAGRPTHEPDEDARRAFIDADPGVREGRRRSDRAAEITAILHTGRAWECRRHEAGRDDRRPSP